MFDGLADDSVDVVWDNYGAPAWSSAWPLAGAMSGHHGLVRLQRKA